MSKNTEKTTLEKGLGGITKASNSKPASSTASPKGDSKNGTAKTQRK